MIVDAHKNQQPGFVAEWWMFQLTPQGRKVLHAALSAWLRKDWLPEVNRGLVRDVLRELDARGVAFLQPNMVDTLVRWCAGQEDADTQQLGQELLPWDAAMNGWLRH